MTRRWFSKLITAAPVAAPLASKVLSEGIVEGDLGSVPFAGPLIPPKNWARNALDQQGVNLYPGSLAKGFPPTSPKSEHYKFLEKSLDTIRQSKCGIATIQFSCRKIHDCNPGYIPQASGVQHNKQRFRLRYQSPGEKWARDRAVNLWNLRRKTTLAEEWEAAKNEIMEACSIEI